MAALSIRFLCVKSYASLELYQAAFAYAKLMRIYGEVPSQDKRNEQHSSPCRPLIRGLQDNRARDECLLVHSLIFASSVLRGWEKSMARDDLMMGDIPPGQNDRPGRIVASYVP